MILLLLQAAKTVENMIEQWTQWETSSGIDRAIFRAKASVAHNEMREEDRKARETLQQSVEGIRAKVDAISQKVGVRGV